MEHTTQKWVVALHLDPKTHPPPAPGVLGGAGKMAGLIWLPVPLLLPVIGLLWAVGSSAVYVSRPLLMVLNFVFATGASLIIVALIGRTYLLRGTPGLLAVGCGVLLWGAAAATASITPAFGSDAAVTVHNSLVWLAAACHLAGVLFSLRTWPAARNSGRNMALAYTGVGWVRCVSVKTPGPFHRQFQACGV